MRLSSDAETSFERPAGSKKPVGFRMPGSDWTSSNDDGLYIAWSDDVALEAAGAWKAAAAPKVEARRSLECIFLWVVCVVVVVVVVVVVFAAAVAVVAVAVAVSVAVVIVAQDRKLYP